VRWNAEFASDKYALLLAGSDDRRSTGSAADRLASKLEALAKIGGLATRLSEGGVEEASLPGLASLAGHQWTGGFNPRPFDAEGALEIYRAAF
jgi:alcohol dehydrogenase class IV